MIDGREIREALTIWAITLAWLAACVIALWNAPPLP